MNEQNSNGALRSVRFGGELSAQDSETLSEMGRVVSLGAGETLFREGERHHRVYWLIDGQITLEMSTGGTTTKSLLTLGQGDLVAWSAMLSAGRMTATAIASEPARLLAFDAQDLLGVCEENHDIGFRVMGDVAGQLAERLLATRLQLLDLFRHPSEEDT